MWESATCPLVTGILLHLTHDMLGKTFPVEDEVVKVGRIGVVVGKFHPLKVFEPHGISNTRSDDAPEADSSQTPNARGVLIYTPDFHVFRRLGLSLSHARTSHSPYFGTWVHHPWIFRSST